MALSDWSVCTCNASLPGSALPLHAVHRHPSQRHRRSRLLNGVYIWASPLGMPVRRVWLSWWLKDPLYLSYFFFYYILNVLLVMLEQCSFKKRAWKFYHFGSIENIDTLKTIRHIESNYAAGIWYPDVLCLTAHLPPSDHLYLLWRHGRHWAGGAGTSHWCPETTSSLL